MKSQFVLVVGDASTVQLQKLRGFEQDSSQDRIGERIFIGRSEERTKCTYVRNIYVYYCTLKTFTFCMLHRESLSLLKEIHVCRDKRVYDGKVQVQ